MARLTSMDPSGSNHPSSFVLREGDIDVMLVENDALVRAFLIEMLSDGGLRVAEASCAAEALEAVNAVGPSTVLVTDLLLGPGMDGTALIAALRERQPAMRAILISGAEVADGKLDPRDAFLAKPFHGDDLVRAVQALRGAAPGLPPGPPLNGSAAET
jgi:CheY-like chemotaxis protein